MDTEKFMKLVEARFKHSRAVLSRKNEEYTRGGDKLHNFKRAGAMQGISAEKALIGMASKHIVSVFDLADDVERLDTIEPEYVEEKIGDAINYLLLLEALICERYGWEVLE